jgi:prolyl 4-hydroxylase
VGAVTTSQRIDDADRLLIGSTDALPEPEQALAAYREALGQGDGLAGSRLAVMAALGVCQTADWNTALDVLAEGAESGDRFCRRQLAALGERGDRYAEGAVNTPGAWRRVRDELDLEALLTPPPLRALSKDPLVAVAQGFVPPHLAKWLIKRASARLERSAVNDFRTGEVRPDPMRTATVAAFTILHRDMIVLLAQERAARLTQLAVTLHEPPNVISYQPGQQYEPHFDFIDPRVPQFRNELAVLGQRVVTLVTYLNEDFTGAETFFPRLGVQYRGGPGDAVLFQNVRADGAPDERTLHAGLPPKSGRKWVLSQWLRSRPQPLI